MLERNESILEKGKEVLNSQNEKQEIKKEVLFTTVDGVGISQGDLYFSVSDKFDILFTENTQYTINWANRTFSNYEKANEWVLMNKPLLSLKEVLEEHLLLWNKR